MRDLEDSMGDLERVGGERVMCPLRIEIESDQTYVFEERRKVGRKEESC
jgi:hypothetical protein